MWDRGSFPREESFETFRHKGYYLLLWGFSKHWSPQSTLMAVKIFDLLKKTLSFRKISIIYTDANIFCSGSSKIKFSADQKKRATPIIQFILIMNIIYRKLYFEACFAVVIARHTDPSITWKFSLLYHIFRKIKKRISNSVLADTFGCVQHISKSTMCCKPLLAYQIIKNKNDGYNFTL